MICKNCGAQLPEGTAFCTNCGCAVEAPQAQPAQPQYQAQPQPTYQQPMYGQTYAAQPVGAQPNTLILGILSLVFCELGIVGLILAIIARKKGKAYIAQGGQLTGAAKVGHILALVGLILSICYMAFWAIYLVVIIIAAIGSSATSYSYYY